MTERIEIRNRLMYTLNLLGTTLTPRAGLNGNERNSVPPKPKLDTQKRNANVTPNAGARKIPILVSGL